MFRSGGKRRVRPSLKSLALSLVVCPAGLYLATFLPFDTFLEPLGATLIIALAVDWFRFRRVRQGLPQPYGKGLSTLFDSAAMARSGMLLIVGGIVLVVGVLGASLLVPLIPPAVYFAMVFGLMAGFPLSEIVFFGGLWMLERSAKGKIFEIVEDAEEDGQRVLKKSLEIFPYSS